MIKAIFASTTSGGIGNRGTLPWPRNSEDLKWFKKHTENHIVVMGRTSWDDPKLPKPLPNRVNYVVTGRALGTLDARVISGNLVEEVKKLQKMFPNKDIFIIGGQNVLEQCQDIVEQIIWTRMKGPYFTDTRLNITRFFAGFRLVSVNALREYSYEVWKRDIYFGSIVVGEEQS